MSQSKPKDMIQRAGILAVIVAVGAVVGFVVTGLTFVKF